MIDNGIILGLFNHFFGLIMLEQLQELETLLSQVINQYHIVATELANLKNRPNNDAKHEATIGELQAQLNQATQQLDELQATLDNNNQMIDHQDKYIDELNAKISQLSQENSDLRQKNRLAIERAEVVQTWLANIDNGNDQSF